MQTSDTLEIQSFIDTRPMSSRQWMLTALCFAIVFCDGMDVAVMGFLAPAIIEQWDISRAGFGLVMAAAPIGLALGAIFAGSSSDYLGRRKVLLASVFAFGVMTWLTALARTPTDMALLRFATGLGLGAAMPNTTTLLSEYVPQRSRSFILAAMFTGFNLGSAIIGFIAAFMLPRWGWQSVLHFGAAIPLALWLVMLFALPESARFMVVRGRPMPAVGRVLGRVIGADLGGVSRFALAEEKLAARQPVAALFTRPFALRTFALWVCYFMGLLVIYLTTSWLPTMIRDAGLPVDRAANVTAMFQLGGTAGAILVGLAMDRFGATRSIALAYLLGGGALILLGMGGLQTALLALTVGLVGFCMSGGQTGLNAYAPTCYPTAMRATGVSWMLGVGRLGSILGSSIGGVLLGFGWDFTTIFCVLAVPAALAAAAITVSGIGRGAGQRAVASA
ncbi:MFS transporter [Paracoccus shandongensis]|uniref:MFS transporter n=1 Tax=Paracoccus shandongensis TaxID=2816048 RepID=UPI001A8DB718|nr:MFS transporter [Paracoccus shandongensis]